MTFASILEIFNALTWIEIALLIFVAVFISVVIWVMGARKGAFTAASQIPLNEDR